MENIKAGALPTNKNNLNLEDLRSKRTELFSHYLNHRGLDIPNARRNSSKKPVIENIIRKFNTKYRPERFSIEDASTLDNGSILINSSGLQDDSLKDLRQVAHLVVWQATEKYLVGCTFKGKKITYQNNFHFCIFASNYLKFQLRLHLRHINADRNYGNLPDSDAIRKLYSILPKYKNNNPYKDFLTSDDYKKISLEHDININLVKKIDQYFTSRAISGDRPIISDEPCKNKMWDILEFNNEEFFQSSQNIEEELDTHFKNKKLKLITLDFLKKLSKRDCEIFNEVKLKESENVKLKDLSIKFNISSERVRQISEKIFKDYEILLKKNKKHLWDD